MCVYTTAHAHVYVCVLSHCVRVPLSLHASVRVHTCTHVFPHHHLLMQSAIMCTAPLISLLCMVTVLWKSRDVCTAAGCSIRDAWSCNTIEKVHVVYDFPWLLCVIAGCVVLCVQQAQCAVKASYSLSGFWHLPLASCSLPSPVWFLGITHSCPDLKLLYNL